MLLEALGVKRLCSRRSGFPSKTLLAQWQERFRQAGFNLDDGDISACRKRTHPAESAEHYSDELGNSAEIRARWGHSRGDSFLQVTILLAEV